MENEILFQYTYSASQNREVLQIRDAYLPRNETKLEELIRLDSMVQTSGTTEALCAGIGGCQILGLGLYLSMKNAMCILLGLAGLAGILLAYPVHRNAIKEAKKKYAPRILELAAELSNPIR